MQREWIEKMARGESLSADEASEAAGLFLEGKASEDDIVSFLGTLADKGEKVEEICGFAQRMMNACIPMKAEGKVIDVCGTGGSGLSRFNISTASAFILAAAGCPVVKHGNKGSRQPNGSFDLLEELGLDIMAPVEQRQAEFEKFKLTFLFARAHHPAAKHVASARAKLGRRSIFNLVGPLCNPAGVSHQVMGVSDPATGNIMAQALGRLGRKRALVVYGHPGVDEVSISGTTRTWLVEGDSIREGEFRPSDFGLAEKTYNSLPGGDAKVNAELLRKLLRGENCDGLLDLLLFSTGVSLWIGEIETSIERGIDKAGEVINSRAAEQLFHDFLSK